MLVDIFNLPELEHASNDISYCMYEMDFGREAKSHPIRTNHKTYILDTAEKLYDYLMEKAKIIGTSAAIKLILRESKKREK